MNPCPHPVHARPGTDDTDARLPEGFFPMRLVLRPDGDELELDRPNVLLGRHSDADVRLPTPDISRRHCRFVFSEGVWELYDLNSLNGVFVNGERVSQTVLHDRDLVAVGSFRLQVDLRAHPEQCAGPGDHAFPDRVLDSIAQALPATEMRRRDP